MCLATVYVESNGERKEVMRDVAWIRQQGHELQLITLMRDKQVIEARIKVIDLMTSSVILEQEPSPGVDDQAH